MDTLHLTSPPRTSTRHPGYLWIYYSATTADGRACGCLVPAYCKNQVYKGMEFDRSQLVFDERLKAEVLALVEQAEVPEDPAFPDDPERGWGDVDGITSVGPTPSVGRTSGVHGTRGPAHRKAVAEAQGQGIPTNLLQLLDTVARSYNFVRTRIGATDPPRSDHARALAITALIAYTREQGATVSSEENTSDAIEKILAAQV